MRQARPGNALDAASSRRMSHRRYGKPVRLDYKAPARSLCLSALSAGVFSATLSSSRSSVPRPSASPPSLQAVSTFLPVPRLSLSLSCLLSSSNSRILFSLLSSRYSQDQRRDPQSSLCRAAHTFRSLSTESIVRRPRLTEKRRETAIFYFSKQNRVASSLVYDC